MNDPALIDEMLRKSQTIAVVGMSDKPWRASHNIGRYLVMQGYRVLPVNPKLKEVHGLKANEVPPIVEDVIRLGIPYLWLQEDVINDRAMTRARSAGVKAVQNVCIFREHAQRVG